MSRHGRVICSWVVALLTLACLSLQRISRWLGGWEIPEGGFGWLASSRNAEHRLAEKPVGASPPKRALAELVDCARPSASEQ
jgi:hypothetical protein